MGKRSAFERIERDFYWTPEAAVLPLLPHLPFGTMFVEPCAGDGRLVKHLEKHGMSCLFASDIEPRAEFVRRRDALDLWFRAEVPSADMCITNPPWGRKVLHPMIDAFRVQLPTWLLFDADWAHTVQAARFMPYCRKIVSVGRVKWIEGSTMTGKDNCAWYLFTAEAGACEFHGKVGA
ncbi:MAG: hypothetical protein VR71_02080 [Roseovarius sp. BRH_c41]|uniref:hypothetical protein n=1 Tax=Roseovarius sp. BRH_c41 TaxID=1629709 RepID=UPI0005F26EFE|nr:hypothetical protein [Roseovarius sp. BRH_c41]KJS45225.1 MAG: hypothetical protein VR71_02080 [Roseovarius sp. BRH_c41]